MANSNTMGLIPRGEYGPETSDQSGSTITYPWGAVREFQDVDANTGEQNSQLPVICMLMQNKSGGVLLPKNAVRFGNTVTGQSGAKVSALSQLFHIVDEYLPAAGVPANATYWGVIKGPTTALAVSVSGAKSAGQLPVQSSTTSGKVDFTDLAPGTATIAQAAAGYGYRAFTEGAIADGATEYRIILNSNFPGQ